MRNNVLFTVTNLNLIDKLKEKGITNFVYPFFSYCVGIPNTFHMEEIKEENAYLLINMNLDTKKIDELASVLHNLPNNIKGIIFEDVGLIEVLKDIGVQKILYYNHFNTNFKSVNIFFKYVDEIIISADITEKEIDEIIINAENKISLFVFGLISSLYSRRLLLTSHNKHYNLPDNNKMNLNIKDKKFIAFENENGTVLYHYPYYNGKRLLDKDVKYLFYFPVFLSDEEVLAIADNNFDVIDTDEGFLDTKTIYKVKENN